MRKSVVALGIALLLALAGCAGERESAEPTPTETERRVPAITVSGAWGRESPAMADRGAVYMEITNNGNEDDELISASVSPDLVERVELHETVSTSAGESPGASPSPMGTGEGSMMRLIYSEEEKMEGDDSKGHSSGESGTEMGGSMTEMRPVKSIKIPAGKTVKLEPGGYHIMLVGFKKKLEVGTSYPIDLVFKKAGKVSTNFEVRAQ